MSLLTLSDVSLAYGHHPLLAHVDFQIEAGERVCLVGRNGTGKSTLFRVIAGVAQPDDGAVWHDDTLRISHLEQDVPPDAPQTIFEVVAAGLGELSQLLTDYHKTLVEVSLHREGALARMTDLQHQLEVRDGWTLNQRVESVLSRLALPADKLIADCSGGVRRRVMLAQALVSAPDLLLLDEPTNHMDISAITWLEEYLLGYQGALIFITHDRTFLRHLATRIVELDRGVLTSFPGDYANYLRRKDEMLDAENKANARFDKKLTEYEAWLRQGIKARRTRNEGKVRALLAMREARSRRIGVQGRVSLEVDRGESSGKLVADLRNVGFAYGERVIIRELSTRIMRGDRIGIVGPNGSGKSTLLRLILGELKPTAGEVVMGTRLQVAYFSQQREALQVDRTVRDNISDGQDYIPVKGQSRHVISYLKDFLFPPERIDSPVSTLSGGERNRLLLAKIFARPANMMVLDEPTNDLDVDTLELLEDLLTDYDGTLLLVSHDRSFLDNVVTSTLVFEGDGRVGEYVGGYEDWLRQRDTREVALKPDRQIAEKAVRPCADSGTRRKLSFNEKRELELLPQAIESLETQQQVLEQQVNDPAFYRRPGDEVSRALSQLERVHHDLHQAYERWSYLDSLGI